MSAEEPRREAPESYVDTWEQAEAWERWQARYDAALLVLRWGWHLSEKAAWDKAFGIACDTGTVGAAERQAFAAAWPS